MHIWLPNLEEGDPFLVLVMLLVGLGVMFVDVGFSDVYDADVGGVDADDANIADADAFQSCQRRQEAQWDSQIQNSGTGSRCSPPPPLSPSSPSTSPPPSPTPTPPSSPSRPSSFPE